MAAKFIRGIRPASGLSFGLIVLGVCLAACSSHASKLDPAPWQILNYSGSLASSLTSQKPAPPTGLALTLPDENPPPPTPPPNPGNLLTNLTDNKLATFVTLSHPPILLTDLAQTSVIHRVVLNGSAKTLNLWPDYLASQERPPLGLIVVYVGDTPTTTNRVAEFTVPYDAGNPVETEADLRFSPASGRYVRIELQTQVVWGPNTWPGMVVPLQPPSTNVALNIGELELFGFDGTNAQIKADAVVIPPNSPAPLALAASELSYYLGELEGRPVPIIAPAATNNYPGTLYVIKNLASLAPTYATMMSNISSGLLPTNVNVQVSGRQVIFSSWPYRTVLWSVWEFLERQGVRWLYPDAHGDYVPAGNGVDPSKVPFQYTPPTLSIYANFDINVLEPWPVWQKQSVRPDFLYLWRNHWTCSQSGYGPLGGAEIPAMPAPNVTVNSDYTEGFEGYPHNFNNVVPTRILNLNSNWWGYSAAAGARVAPNISDAPAFCMDQPSLIDWVAAKMTNIAAARPLASSVPLNICHWRRPFNLLPLDAAVYCQDTGWCTASNSPPQANSDPWVKVYDQACSGMYYSFVNGVAKKVGPGIPVGALAYADVFVPPPSIASLAPNVHVEVCLYGSPNLPMTAPANALLKSALDGWHAKCQHLSTYDYALLHTDYYQMDPRLPVPLVAGLVDRSRYLANIGALDGGTQGNLESIPYNPWNFYAYPRTRWNTNWTSIQLEQEFFTGYFREAAAPMQAYYQVLENYQVLNNVDMHYGGYCYGITPGSFPLAVLQAMGTNLVLAESQATNWFVIDRIAKVRAGYDWVILNSGRQGVNLTDLSPYPLLNAATGAVTVNLTSMTLFPTNAVLANNAMFNNNTGGWDFYSAGQVQQTLNVPTAGTYTVHVTAKGIASSLGVFEPDGGAASLWPIMNVYLGPGSGSVTVTSPTNFIYSFPMTIPAGASDLVISFKNSAPAGSRAVLIKKVQVTKP